MPKYKYTEVKCTKEAIKLMLDGQALYSSDGEIKYWYDGEFCHFIDDYTREPVSDFSCALYRKEEIAWWEDIPKTGVLCRAGGGIALMLSVEHHNDTALNKYFMEPSCQGEWFYDAVPLTDEEIEDLKGGF
ncbi:MAG: hypothetical protein ACN2B6_00355 [Rickettsiales bacterium]